MKEYIKDQIKKSYETKQIIYEDEELLNNIVDVAQKCVALYRTDKKNYFGWKWRKCCRCTTYCR
jgi:D-sedoheptulose 7-phosphate isomerase